MKTITIKLLVVGILCLCSLGKAIAQTNTETKTSWWKNKIAVGGNFAFNVGNRTGIVEVSPSFSLRLTQKFITSLDVLCQYSWDNKYSISNFSYGFGLSARYTIIDNMYVYAQYTYNPYIVIDNLSENTSKGLHTGLWIGAGYTKRISTNVTVYSGIIYNVLAGPNADDNPRISGGISYQL
ncbi:MAG: hypothetical protein J6V33_01825 [Bacteroidales bacterium]|nr:hypothetical protein [Bacteroidales bacterium]